jgi:hypothetical protein
MLGGQERGLWSALMPDYVRFHAMELRSGDVDPVYGVLQQMAGEKHHRHRFTPREMALLSFLHVAYYDLGSALRAMTELNYRVNYSMIPRISHLPCGTERRGHRDPRQLARHLEALFDIDRSFDGLHEWAQQWRSYGEMFGALQGIYGNGRWAAYKTSELLSWSLRHWYPAHALEWLPTDMGHAHSSGPRKGLELVVNRVLPTGHSAAAVRRLDAVSNQLLGYLIDVGARGNIAQVETTLCDFASMYAGRYYPGHDIHQMGWQLSRASVAFADDAGLFERNALASGRRAAALRFPIEITVPVDLDRKSLYKRTGVF